MGYRIKQNKRIYSVNYVVSNPEFMVEISMVNCEPRTPSMDKALRVISGCCEKKVYVWRSNDSWVYGNTSTGQQRDRMASFDITVRDACDYLRILCADYPKGNTGETRRNLKQQIISLIEKL